MSPETFEDLLKEYGEACIKAEKREQNADWIRRDELKKRLSNAYRGISNAGDFLINKGQN